MLHLGQLSFVCQVCCVSHIWAANTALAVTNLYLEQQSRTKLLSRWAVLYTRCHRYIDRKLCTNMLASYKDIMVSISSSCGSNEHQTHDANHRTLSYVFPKWAFGKNDVCGFVLCMYIDGTWTTGHAGRAWSYVHCLLAGEKYRQKPFVGFVRKKHPLHGHCKS